MKIYKLKFTDDDEVQVEIKSKHKVFIQGWKAMLEEEFYEKGTILPEIEEIEEE